MTTQAVSGRRYFTKAWLLEQKVAHRSVSADRDCFHHEP